MDSRSASDEQLSELALRLGEALRARELTIATAESCTGGWIAQAITSVPGSSQWFERGFVTYSNRAKQEMLGVREATLAAHGAVSEETVSEMAEGALRHSRAQVVLAISGIAGPGGGVLDKPVGTVCLAWAGVGVATRTRTEHYAGGRQEVRRAAVAAALAGVLEMLATWT
jgi:nicotinamide-nucleotide amidase